MTNPSTSNHKMQEATTSTETITESIGTDEQDHPVTTITLRLKKPKNPKKVKWTNETVDNEHLNKKKSKACCIYHKPKKFDESNSDDSDDSDDEDNECDHSGHSHKDNDIGNPSSSEQPE